MQSANYANCDQTDHGDYPNRSDQINQSDQTDQNNQGNQTDRVDLTDQGDQTDHRIEYERGGARTVKHAKLPISSFDETVSEWVTVIIARKY